jgi:hypothetical protein
MTQPTLTHDQIEQRFDDGEDILDQVDLSAGRLCPPQTGPETVSIKRVNVDFPDWMVSKLDTEAKRLNISRQAVIKTMLASLLRRSHA